MPESEPKPRLIELVDPGVGQGWKAVLKSGKSVVVHEIPVPAAEAAGAVPRIQRLFEKRHPALSPVLAWGTDPNGLWVAVEPNEGVPLGTILSRGPLTPPAAAALGASLLSGVAALHEAGIAMGGFGAAAVRVTGNGEVRLAGHPAGAVRGAPSQSDLRADVRSSGMAICAAFGVDPAGAPAPPNIPPGLVVTMRSMASGAMGPAADRAQGALREMAAALLAPDRATAAQAELATRAGGREMPATPFIPKTEAPAQASAPPAPPPFVPTVPRDATPLPRQAASYDPPPRAPEPQAPAPPVPSAYAPYTPPETPAPEAPPEAPPEPTAWVTKPPAATSPPAPISPWGTTVPPPAAPAAPTSAPAAPASPWGTTAPPPTNPPANTTSPATFASAPTTWETATPVPIPEAAPAAPAPYVPPSSPPTPKYEPPTSTPTPTAAPAPAQPTWTPVATPVWTPGGVPAVDVSPETAAPRPATVPPPTPARRPVPRADDGQQRARPAWLIPAAIGMLILLLLIVGAVIYLKTRPSSSGSPIAHATPSAKTSPKASPRTSPKASPTATSTGALQSVPTYAPASAGQVSSVAFCIQPTHPCQGVSASDYTNCKLSGPCKVMVEVKFSAAQNGNVSYVLRFFNRCTGTTTNLPGASFTPSGFNRVDLLKVVTLPSGAKAAALVAVTTNPASAASAPLLLGGDSC
jgi:hypothetical protein